MTLSEEFGRVFREAAELAERQDMRGQIYVSPISCIWQSQSRNLYMACVACERAFREVFEDFVAENNTQAILMLSLIAESYDDR
jgi:hypothetical protein